ncbi:hypothetical protein PR048_024205 [Dryococelus australis]|uniref:Uncharacterized protein n=1 Tax=Dryococelus australis TaxID=614101 RepID=A0ABQ9GW86_9NEOP|nr:hypothetical protein PR048_024205 [Dryococelus australis]
MSVERDENGAVPERKDGIAKTSSDLARHDSHLRRSGSDSNHLAIVAGVQPRGEELGQLPPSSASLASAASLRDWLGEWRAGQTPGRPQCLSLLFVDRLLPPDTHSMSAAVRSRRLFNLVVCVEPVLCVFQPSEGSYVLKADKGDWDEYGEAPECKSEGNGRPPRKPADEPHLPTRFPHAKNGEGTDQRACTQIARMYLVSLLARTRQDMLEVWPRPAAILVFLLSSTWAHLHLVPRRLGHLGVAVCQHYCMCRPAPTLPCTSRSFFSLHDNTVTCLIPYCPLNAPSRFSGEHQRNCATSSSRCGRLFLFSPDEYFSTPSPYQVTSGLTTSELRKKCAAFIVLSELLKRNKQEEKRRYRIKDL